MRTGKFLSIIIPCYNVSEYLLDTINSLHQLQNADECEFIFVNDGSTDNTLTIIQEFAQSDQRATVINQSNAGVSAARNAALEIAKGKYILFLDGDDCLTPNTIELIRNHIGGADVLLTPISIVRESSHQVMPIALQDKEYSLFEFYISCTYFPILPMLVYKNCIIKEHAIRFSSKIHVGEVYTFTCEYLSYAKNILFNHNSFYLYNIRPSSATHAPNFKKDLSILDAIDYIYAHSNTDIVNVYSFTNTLFMLGTSFTYNKYAKSGLLDKEAISVVKKMFIHPNFIKCLKKTAYSQGKWNRNKLLAIYMLTTKVWGYKIIAYMFRLIK